MLKKLACFRFLGTERSINYMDDCAQMRKDTLLFYFRHFWKDLKAVYGAVYLNQRPKINELGGLQAGYSQEGFKAWVGAINCIKLRWNNCPLQLKGQYHSSIDGPLATIQVESWVDHDLYFCHWFSGSCCTNMNKTMVGMSPLFRDILSGSYKFKLPSVHRTGEAGTCRDFPYFFSDLVYPNWPMLVKPIHSPQSPEEIKFTQRQEAVRKDVERFYGVFQGRFKVLRYETFYWHS